MLQIKVESKKIAAGLNRCARIALGNKVNRVYANVRIVAKDKYVRLDATDSNVSLSYYVEGADVISTGEVIVDAESLAVFVSSIAGNLTLRETPKSVIGKIGSAKIQLKKYAGSQQFPDLPQVPFTGGIDIEGVYLNDLFSIAFMAEDDPASVFSGALVRCQDAHISLMTTNKARFGTTKFPIDYDGSISFLLPKKVAEELPRMIFNDEDAKLYFTDRHFFATTDRFTLSSVGLAGKFPVDAISKLMTFDRELYADVKSDKLIDAIRATSIIASRSDDTQFIDFKTEGQHTLIVESRENQLGQSTYRIPIISASEEGMSFTLAAQLIDSVIKAIEKLTKSSISSDILGQKATIRVAVSKRTSFVHIYTRSSTAEFAIAPIRGK